MGLIMNEDHARPVRASRDRWIAAALFVVAATMGAAYVRVFDRSGARAITDFGQFEFGAAVALACGRGFVNPDPAATPGLAAFLALDVDRFSCSDLPPTLPPQPPSLTQGLYRYLMSAVALVWAFGGVSWSGLWPLFGVAYGATIAVCYGLFRLGVGRVLSCAAALAVMVSAVHLGSLPFLRDYAKAPFILGLILVVGYVATRSQQRRPLLLLSALFGIVLGIGFGFRNDILITVPAFVVVMLLWDPPRDRAGLGFRLACLGVAAAAFAVVAWPILLAYSRGSNTGHAAFLGLMTAFNRPLGIAGSIYEWGYTYQDAFARTVISSYSERIAGQTPVYLSREYDQATMAYLVQVARHWPADLIVRAYAAVLRVLEFPYLAGAYAAAVPYGLHDEWVLRGFNAQRQVLQVLEMTGALTVALALVLVSASSLRVALLLLLGVVFFAGYPALQFHVRHFFHLELITWWSLAFVLQRLATLASTRTIPSLQPMLTFTVVAVVLASVPLVAARWYQARHLQPFLHVYAEAPAEDLAIAPEPAGTRTLLRATDLWNRRDPTKPVSAEYVVAEFDPARCPAMWLPLTFRYDVAAGAKDLSLDTAATMSAGDGPTRIMFPAYFQDWSQFAGVEVPPDYERCVTRLSRLVDLRPFPLLLNLTLLPRWTDAALYQTLTDWESRPAAEQRVPRVRTRPSTLPVDQRVLTAPVDRLPAELFRARVVRSDASGVWRISGTPDGTASYVVRLAAEPHGPGDRFIVAGEILRGGVAVGLMRGEEWDGGSVTIATKGPFVVLLAPAEPAEYGVVLANALEDSWLFRLAGARLARLVGLVHTFTDVRITHAGWLTATAGKDAR